MKFACMKDRIIHQGELCVTVITMTHHQVLCKVTGSGTWEEAQGFACLLDLKPTVRLVLAVAGNVWSLQADAMWGHQAQFMTHGLDNEQCSELPIKLYHII